MTASTTRHSHQRGQHPQAATRQPFLGFQFYLGPHPFHTVLECTNIHYSRLIQKLPQPRLSAFQTDNFWAPGYLGQFLGRFREQRQAQDQPAIAQSILREVNCVLPTFLSGYARARSTHSPHNNVQSSTSFVGNNHFIPTTITPTPSVYLPSTGLAFRLHAILQGHTLAPPIFSKSHRPGKPAKTFGLQKEDLIRFGKKTVC